MRIVLDLQACQSASRFRGIGRYSMSFGQALAKCLVERQHEVIVALNASFPDDIDEIKNSLSKVVPKLQFVEFTIPSPCFASNIENNWRQMAARILREYALAALEPDFVHVSTLMADGWDDDAVASIGMLGIHVPTALTHYDLIPLVMEEIYMPKQGSFRDYYMTKLESVRKANLLFAISEYTRAEAVKWLERSERTVVNISSAVNNDFAECFHKNMDTEATLLKFGIEQGFLLYAPGGFDPRKNFDRLLEAYSLLPEEIRLKHKLVITSKLYEGLRDELLRKAVSFGLNPSDVVITDYLTEEELVVFYRTCHLYIFPSLHEGFGLPVLEAMICGAPVIASNCTSIPEAAGMPEALFNPYSVTDITDKMQIALTDGRFRERLKTHAALHPMKFSWERSADTAAQALEEEYALLCAKGWQPTNRKDLPTCEKLLSNLKLRNWDISISAEDLQKFIKCYQENFEISLKYLKNSFH